MRPTGQMVTALVQPPEAGQVERERAATPIVIVYASGRASVTRAGRSSAPAGGRSRAPPAPRTRPSSETSSLTGGGVRDSATAKPITAAMTSVSSAPTRRNATRLARSRTGSTWSPVPEPDADQDDQSDHLEQDQPSVRRLDQVGPARTGGSRRSPPRSRRPRPRTRSRVRSPAAAPGRRPRGRSRRARARRRPHRTTGSSQRGAPGGW